MPITVACLQTRPQPDFDAALTEALTLACQAVDRGAQFLALPEYCGGLKTEGKAFAPPVTSEAAHPVVAGLREFARENNVEILIGSVAVDSPVAEERFRNRSLMIGRDGEVLARYDKIHLFDVNLSERETYRESAKVSPGDRAVVADTSAGPMGLSICYDLRFPHLYRGLAHAGAEVLAIPAAFAVPTGKAHWHVLNRARAIENGAFVISPCAVGSVPGGGASYGHSLIVEPWGQILADGGDAGGVVLAQIDPEAVAQARGRVPSLTHDREFSVEVIDVPEAAA